MENAIEVSKKTFYVHIFYMRGPKCFKLQAYPFESTSEKQERQFKRQIKWFRSLEVLF